MTLLAKKHHPGTPTPPPDLSQHTRDVTDAAEALFGTATRRTRLGDC
jgi:hypothetical protein